MANAETEILKCKIQLLESKTNYLMTMIGKILEMLAEKNKEME